MMTLVTVVCTHQLYVRTYSGLLGECMPKVGSVSGRWIRVKVPGEGRNSEMLQLTQKVFFQCFSSLTFWNLL